jgi:hypothetical protein
MLSPGIRRFRNIGVVIVRAEFIVTWKKRRP